MILVRTFYIENELRGAFCFKLLIVVGDIKLLISVAYFTTGLEPLSQAG